jgi:hypothetical protein
MVVSRSSWAAKVQHKMDLDLSRVLLTRYGEIFELLTTLLSFLWQLFLVSQHAWCMMLSNFLCLLIQIVGAMTCRMTVNGIGHQSVVSARLLLFARPDVLDQALLRPGRFDRRVSVERPDKLGRQQVWHCSQGMTGHICS